MLDRLVSRFEIYRYPVVRGPGTIIAPSVSISSTSPVITKSYGVRPDGARYVKQEVSQHQYSYQGTDINTDIIQVSPPFLVNETKPGSGAAIYFKRPISRSQLTTPTTYTKTVVIDCAPPLKRS